MYEEAERYTIKITGEKNGHIGTSTYFATSDTCPGAISTAVALAVAEHGIELQITNMEILNEDI